MIKIERYEYEKIVRQSIRELPNEACGLLGGIEENGDILIKSARELINIDESNEHFSMDPKEQFRVVKEFREKGYKIFGNYHSHPETPSRMSEEDKRLAHDRKALYAIISLKDRRNPVLNFFRVNSEREPIKEGYEII